MRFDVVSIFPQIISDNLKSGVVGSAVNAGHIQVKTWNPRDLATGAHQAIDDRPFGGGAGMVMLPELLTGTLKKIFDDSEGKKRKVIYLSPQGPVFDQKKAKDLAQLDQVVLICGRYGGIDERVIEKYVDEELSIGNFVLSGGEIAASAVIDATARNVPGTLGNEESLAESMTNSLLQEPLYTRPWEFEGKTPPEVLRSGHHEKIEKWRKSQKVKRTLEKRPDLLANSSLDKDEIKQACEEMSLRHNVALGLVHYPVYNKLGDVVATNVASFDIHDISRACRTFGVDRYYIITPTEEQLAYVGRILNHWQHGRGVDFNPTRGVALENTKLSLSLEAALEDWGEKDALLVSTSARQVQGPKPIGFQDLRSIALKNKVFLLFGTGYGLENSLLSRCNYLLEPIRGRSPEGFNHLSVRSAVSIVLDRLFGPCY